VGQSRRDWLKVCAALALGSVVLPASARAAEQAGPRWIVQPLGPTLSSVDVDFVKTSVQSFYDCNIVVAERKVLPKSAYYPQRQRYRAEKLLDYLETQLSRDADRILGLTSVDISTTKGSITDWGILGLATIDGRVSVLSSFRCRRKTRSPEEATVRLGKIAVHEIGHTLGLEHCPTTGCLMQDAEGSVLTVDHEFDLCAKCRARLNESHRLSRAPLKLPWKKG
jgi:archaemetzincin